MCACEPGFTCSRCVGTPDDPRYPELPDEGEAELRHGGGEREASEDV